MGCFFSCHVGDLSAYCSSTKSEVYWNELNSPAWCHFTPLYFHITTGVTPISVALTILMAFHLQHVHQNRIANRTQWAAVCVHFQWTANSIQTVQSSRGVPASWFTASSIALRRKDYGDTRRKFYLRDDSDSEQTHFGGELTQMHFWTMKFKHNGTY